MKPRHAKAKKEGRGKMMSFLSLSQDISQAHNGNPQSGRRYGVPVNSLVQALNGATELSVSHKDLWKGLDH